MKTLIHKNLHNGLWALTQRGKVVGYCTSATLINCDIREDAKKAFLSRNGGKRTVHLWVRGDVVHVDGFQPKDGRELDLKTNIAPPCTRIARYNPKRGELGFMVDGQLWEGGDAAHFDDVMTVTED